jgi:hypothetical protein
MYIRLVIFLLTIFVVLVPCYGMQVADTTTVNNITITQTKKIEVKKKKVKKSKKIWGVLIFILGIGLIVANTVFVVNSITTLNIILASLGLGITIFGDRIIRKHEPQTKEEDRINHKENLSSLLMYFGGFVAFIGLMFISSAFLASTGGATINMSAVAIFGGIMVWNGLVLFILGKLLFSKARKIKSS